MTTPSPFPPGSLVAAYLRDSGGDDQDLSVDQQVDSIQKWCLDNHLTLTRVFSDQARSGSSTVGRVEFENMIAYFRAKPKPLEAGIILWKFSRFARDLNDAQLYKALLRKSGVIIHSMNDNVPQGMDGQFFESAIDWMNARYLKDLSEDVRRGLHYLIKNYGAAPGSPPRGYMREIVTLGDRRDGSPHQVSRWVPDPKLWDLCKQAWKMRASGVSYDVINEKTHLYSGISSYAYFFTNPIYLGELHYGELVIPDFTQPLIDRYTWDLVQAVSSRGIAYKHRTHYDPEKVTHPRRVRSEYLLSGLVHCSKCGALMSGGNHKRKGFTSKYYVCSNTQHHRGCHARFIPQPALDNSIIHLVSEQILASENVQKIQDDYSRYIGSQDHESHIQDLRQQLGRIAQRSSRVTDAIAEMGHSVLLLEKLTDLETQQKELHLRLDSELRKIEMKGQVPITEVAARMGRSLIMAGIDDQRGILRSMISRIDVERLDNQLIGIINYQIPQLTPSADSVCLYNRATGENHNIYTHSFVITLNQHWQSAYSITMQDPVKDDLESKPFGLQNKPLDRENV